MNAYDELASYRFASGRDYDKRSVETFRARGLNLVDDLLNQITVLRDEVETLRALVPQLPPAAPMPKHDFADSWLTALATEAEFPPPSAPALADRPRFDMEQRSDQQRESGRPGELSGWLTGLESTPAAAEVASSLPTWDAADIASPTTTADDLWPTEAEVAPDLDATTDGDVENDDDVARIIDFVDESEPVDAPEIPEPVALTDPFALDAPIEPAVSTEPTASEAVETPTTPDSADSVWLELFRPTEPGADALRPSLDPDPVVSLAADEPESTATSAWFETVAAEAVTDGPEAVCVTDASVPEPIVDQTVPVPVAALPTLLDDTPTFHDDLRRLEDLDLAHAEAAAAEPPTWAVPLAPTASAHDLFAAAPSADPTPDAPAMPATVTTATVTTPPAATIPPPPPLSAPAMVPAGSSDPLGPMPTSLVPVGSAAVGGSSPRSVTAYARGQVDQWPIVIEALPHDAVGLPVPVRHWSGWLKD